MIVNDIKCYDGTLIHERFAYKYHRKKVLPIGNIIAFRAPMRVELTGMIDCEDVLNDDFIYSDDAINFCWEIPNLCPMGAVAFQRLFNTQIAYLLSSSKYLNNHIEVDGDDIIVHAPHQQHGIEQSKGKCSVSITYAKDNVAIGHTGINVVAGKKAPAFAFSTNLETSQVEALMIEVCELFYNMTDDIFTATTKVIV